MRFFIMITLAAALLLHPAPAWAEIYSTPPFPKGTLGYARPPIGIHVSTTGGETILSARAYVDGTAYDARRDGDLIFYQPEVPLSPGRHSAEVEVIFDGRWRPVRAAWEFTVGEGALSDLPPPTTVQRQVRDAVNRFRAEADLLPLRLEPALNAAAQAHAWYYIFNPSEGLAAHNEEPGRFGFTGVKPWDRGSYFGYPYFTYYEDMHFLLDHAAAAREWLDSVYHRFPITDPNVQDMGYGFAAGRGTQVNVLVTATAGRSVRDSGLPMDEFAGLSGRGSGEPRITVYPVPGQRHVPPRWDGFEIPDPYRPFPGARAAGYPVTIQFDRTVVGASAVDYAAITDKSGNPVPLWVLTGSVDSQIAPNIALLPARDLAPGTRYHVQVRGTLRLTNGEVRPFARKWWFTTEGPEKQPLAAPDIKVFLNGQPLSFNGLSLYILNGRVMLPFRALLERLGATVDWDPDRGNVLAILNDHHIVFKVGNDRAVVDGRDVQLDAVPFIIGGRTRIPVRFAAEALGLQVSWDAATRSVHLAAPGPL